MPGRDAVPELWRHAPRLRQRTLRQVRKRGVPLRSRIRRDEKGDALAIDHWAPGPAPRRETRGGGRSSVAHEPGRHGGAQDGPRGDAEGGAGQGGRRGPGPGSPSNATIQLSRRTVRSRTASERTPAPT